MWQQIQGWLTLALMILIAAIHASWIVSDRTSKRRLVPIPPIDVHAEQLRIERAGVVEARFKSLEAQIQSLHQKASDYGDEQQVKIGVISDKLTRLDEHLKSIDHYIFGKKE